MQALPLKMLFLKKGTASAIIAIALLIALLASVNTLINNINSQTTLITNLASAGDTFLVTSENSNSLLDSRIPPSIITQVKNNPSIKYSTSQQIIQATLETKNGTYPVIVRGVDDPEAFLKNTRTNINGAIAQDNQANVGVILARLSSLNKNDLLNLTIDGKQTQLNITSIFQANQQIDTQIIIPLSTLQALTLNNQISFIEFSIKDPQKATDLIENLTKTLPEETKITNTQQVPTFAQDINDQTATFINVWSIAVYIVVIASSYVIASRIIDEARFELHTLRTIGAKRKTTLTLILTYTMAVAFAGALVGISLGIVGTQTASTLLRWQFESSFLNPFLTVQQALEILLLALAASLIGSIYPAIKGTKIIAQETQL